MGDKPPGGIYSKAVGNASVGATANTFDNVGTVTLRSDATMTLGVWILAAEATSTAAEAIHGQARLSSSDLNVGQQVYNAPPYHGGAPATNIDFRTANAKFLPFVHEANGKENVVIDYSTGLPDPTAANSVVAAVVYVAGITVGSIPMEVKNNWPYNGHVAGGSDYQSKASITTVAETALTDLKIPGWASSIVSLASELTPNLMTAAEEVVGFCRFRSSMPNFEPQEWPFMIAYGAPLGTPVGKGGEAQVPLEAGTYFPTTGQNETVTPNIVLNAAITTGHGGSASAQFR